ncbi:vitellogenin-like isoform X2 [Lasioglossum baleicum]
MEFNFTSIPMSRDAVKRSNYTVMNLFCRPKGGYSLNCRMGNCRGQSIDLTNDNQLEMSEEIYQRFCDGVPFEVKFNERGIEHLIVHEKLPVYVLNDLKLITECLNIGVDLNGIPDGTIDVPQDTTIGRCNVQVGINHYPSKGPVNKMRNHRYELESLPQLNKVAGEAIVIQKTTNLNNCSRYAPFYFGSYGNNVVEPDLHSHLESSSSRIFISDVRFVSTLTRTGTLGSDKLNNLVAISEYLSVTLRDIRAAKRELMDVPDASKTSIEVNSEVNKIYKME